MKLRDFLYKIIKRLCILNVIDHKRKYYDVMRKLSTFYSPTDITKNIICISFHPF